MISIRSSGLSICLCWSHSTPDLSAGLLWFHLQNHPMADPSTTGVNASWSHHFVSKSGHTDWTCGWCLSKNLACSQPASTAWAGRPSRELQWCTRTAFSPTPQLHPGSQTHSLLGGSSRTIIILVKKAFVILCNQLGQHWIVWILTELNKWMESTTFGSLACSSFS